VLAGSHICMLKKRVQESEESLREQMRMLKEMDMSVEQCLIRFNSKKYWEARTFEENMILIATGNLMPEILKGYNWNDIVQSPIYPFRLWRKELDYQKMFNNDSDNPMLARLRVERARYYSEWKKVTAEIRQTQIALLARGVFFSVTNNEWVGDYKEALQTIPGDHEAFLLNSDGAPIRKRETEVPKPIFQNDNPSTLIRIGPLIPIVVREDANSSNNKSSERSYSKEDESVTENESEDEKVETVLSPALEEFNKTVVSSRVVITLSSGETITDPVTVQQPQRQSRSVKPRSKKGKVKRINSSRGLYCRSSYLTVDQIPDPEELIPVDGCTSFTLGDYFQFDFGEEERSTVSVLEVGLFSSSGENIDHCGKDPGPLGHGGGLPVTIRYDVIGVKARIVCTGDHSSMVGERVQLLLTVKERDRVANYLTNFLQIQSPGTERNYDKRLRSISDQCRKNRSKVSSSIRNLGSLDPSMSPPEFFFRFIRFAMVQGALRIYKKDGYHHVVISRVTYSGNGNPGVLYLTDLFHGREARFSMLSVYKRSYATVVPMHNSLQKLCRLSDGIANVGRQWFLCFGEDDIERFFHIMSVNCDKVPCSYRYDSAVNGEEEVHINIFEELRLNHRPGNKDGIEENPGPIRVFCTGVEGEWWLTLEAWSTIRHLRTCLSRQSQIPMRSLFLYYFNDGASIQPSDSDTLVALGIHDGSMFVYSRREQAA